MKNILVIREGKQRHLEFQEWKQDELDHKRNMDESITKVASKKKIQQCKDQSW